MKKFLCVIIAMLLMVTCTGCGSNSNNDNDSDSSFVIVETHMLAAYPYKIVYHKDTKVMYVVGYYADFAVMLNPDGSPMVWEGE